MGLFYFIFSSSLLYVLKAVFVLFCFNSLGQLVLLPQPSKCLDYEYAHHAQKEPGLDRNAISRN